MARWEDGATMLVRSALPFLVEYLRQLNEVLQTFGPKCVLTKGQQMWLGFCLTAMLVTNRLCWASFERLSLGRVHDGALSWMLRHSSIVWDRLVGAGVCLILKRYGIRNGFLVIDDTGRKRSKQTTRIYGAHTFYDTKTGGHVRGQEIVFLLLVTPKVTIPVGFEFYRPDPDQKRWKEQDRRLRKNKVPKRDRPPPPPTNPAYPSKQAIALSLIRTFCTEHAEIAVDGIVSDAAFLSPTFAKQCRRIYPSSIVVSFLRSTQTIRTPNRQCSVQDFFRRQIFVEEVLHVRGHRDWNISYCSARVHVRSHGRKFHVVALRYAHGVVRYLACDDLTWRARDILHSAALRWLIEVFFEDWKCYEAWAQAAFQLDEEGSRRGLVLSLLVDVSLLAHPEHVARIEHNLTTCTVASLRDQLRAECFVREMQALVQSADPHQALHDFCQDFARTYPLRASSKHRTGGLNPPLGPAPSLVRRHGPTQALLNQRAATA
jgi:hypothetical protein